MRFSPRKPTLIWESWICPQNPSNCLGFKFQLLETKILGPSRGLSPRPWWGPGLMKKRIGLGWAGPEMSPARCYPCQTVESVSNSSRDRKRRWISADSPALSQFLGLFAAGLSVLLPHQKLKPESLSAFDLCDPSHVYDLRRSAMANFLAQFQTIKSSCDHLIIAGKSLSLSLCLFLSKP